MKILVIRRDNIGDLVCTTPLLTALKDRFPQATLHVLANSYTAEVLRGHPAVDQVFSYVKAKHRMADTSLVRVYAARAALLWRLYRQRYDYVLVAEPRCRPRLLRLARLLVPRHIVAFTEPGCRGAQWVDMAVPYGSPGALHEVEDIFRLGSPLGIAGPPGPLLVLADERERERARHTVAGLDVPAGFPRLLALHISARKTSQRLPVAQLAALARALHARHRCAFVLLWSPGDAANPLHPGDDHKAEEFMAATADLPVVAYPTHRLAELIAALSICDAAILSDGGAMHIAAALDKPILCFFGRSDPDRWRPWRVPHVVLQPESREVADLTLPEILAGWEALLAKMGAQR